jgi:2-polyprenyl-3-methyl-5-hydroxy-6-metoxy-1,4-benzoquinol methylase
MSLQQQIYPICPVCQNDDISFAFACKDYSLTQESFEIIKCNHCSFHSTYPIPSKENIGPYYQFPEYISHTDVQEGWMNQLYHKVRQRTLSQKTNWIQSLFTGHKGNLLEIGAGTGAFANAMTLKGWSVTALEPDEASRSKALDNYNIQLLPIDHLSNLPQQHFDVITLWHVLEHVHDLSGYMDSFTKLLKKNGRLIIAVPNHTSFDAQYYKQFWAAYDVPRHLYHFSPAAMETLCSKYEMRVLQFKPMWFDSFYVSLLSEKYKQTKYIGVFRAFCIGLISNLFAVRNNKKASSIIYEIKLKN